MALKDMIDMLSKLKWHAYASSVGFDSYKNELETIKVFSNAPGQSNRIQKWWNEKVECEKNTKYCAEKSNNLREQGNKLFKESTERNALDACRLYTKAIFAAPPGSEALALAHANRAVALHRFGYFQQAYDDCECALEQEYPKNLRHKVIARQAVCAEKLGDPVLLQKHLDSLTALQLNENYTAQVEELKQSLEKLKRNKENSAKNEQNDIKEYKGSHRIVETELKGRCLIAVNSIKKDELIFTERARSFLPANKGNNVCHYCAVTQLIPFPCYNCYGRVVYCSSKCRVAHQATHAYECLGHQAGIFIYQGSKLYQHMLCLRIVLDEVPDIISYLRQKRTAKDIWNELTCEESSLMQSKLPYTQTLRMTTHLEKECLADVSKIAADGAIGYTWYLRYKTNFFNLFKKTKASLKDWELVIASLILRHYAQIRNYSRTVRVMTVEVADPFDSILWVNNLWQSPFHVRRGFFHKFYTIQEAIVANFPYFSNCANACYPSMVTKENGRYLSAYAFNNIDAGGEIAYSHVPDYRNASRKQRQSSIMKLCRYECKCMKCTKDYPDDDFEKFHHFRCEKCRQIFIDEIDIQIDAKSTPVRCTKCHAMQNKFYNYLRFVHEIYRVESKDLTIQQVSNFLNKIIKVFKGLDNWLLGPHDFKYKIAITLIEKCFQTAEIAFSVQFNFYDFSQIIKILKFHLKYTIERYDLKSIEHVSRMIYLWDFIAMGKYECTAAEMQEMLHAIEILPDETRKLFNNYYNDYIVGNIK